MDDYTITYQKSGGITHVVHPSWYKLCELQTKSEVIALLKKHFYEPGEYILHFYAYHDRILRKKEQNFFSCQIQQVSDRVPEGVVTIGFINFDYYDNTFDAYDFHTCWPEIDCAIEVKNATAKFTVAGANISPSPKEFERICEKAYARFMKKLYRAADFPIIMECDYPDVIFEICFEQEPSNKVRMETLKVIEDFAVKYNKRHESGIHHVAELNEVIDNRNQSAVYIHVDFGDCKPEVLISLLKAIGKSKLQIKEITLS